jgi:hypothetical protein
MSERFYRDFPWLIFGSMAITRLCQDAGVTWVGATFFTLAWGTFIAVTS